MSIQFIYALVEGASDVPVVEEILSRRFGLSPGTQFLIAPHRGRGTLPDKPLNPPDKHNQTLLHQLPAKLRAWSTLPGDQLVLVVVDADDNPAAELLADLEKMLDQLPKRPPNVMFRLAIEETESWFLADWEAIRAAYPKARVKLIESIEPDAIVGAWERLAECLGRFGQAAPKDKQAWAKRIAPHLNLESPRSPSLARLLSGLASAGVGAH